MSNRIFDSKVKCYSGCEKGIKFVGSKKRKKKFVSRDKISIVSILRRTILLLVTSIHSHWGLIFRFRNKFKIKDIMITWDAPSAEEEVFVVSKQMMYKKYNPRKSSNASKLIVFFFKENTFIKDKKKFDIRA